MEMKGIKVKKIDKAYIGFEKSEILGIKWISFESVISGNPNLYIHIRLKDGKEKYIPLHKDTYYPITCKECKINDMPILTIH